MANFQFLKLDKIYPSREEALKKLKRVQVPYATGVVIRYIEKDIVPLEGHYCCCSPSGPTPETDPTKLILAIYKSGNEGDYEVAFDSGNPKEGNGGSFRVFSSTLPDVSDYREGIAAAIFGEVPRNTDMVILYRTPSKTTSTYMFVSGKWTPLGTNMPEGGNLVLSEEETETITLTLTPGKFENSVIISAALKYNDKSLTVDEDGLRVKTIYGGSF